MERKYATMPRQSNLAYRMSAAAPAKKPAEQTRILREPETVAAPVEKRRINFSLLLCVVTAAVLTAVTVATYAQLSELNVRAAALEKEYSRLTLEYSTIEAAQDRSINIAELQEYAETRLGMVRQNASHVEYIRLGGDDEIRVLAEENDVRSVLSRILTDIGSGIEYIIEYFR